MERIDCNTGEKVARDYERIEDVDVGTLLTEGIGPVSEMKIRMAGLVGGGLPNSTYDGWSVDSHPLSWPVDDLFLMPPMQTLLWSQDGTLDSIVRFPPTITELRAFGFSPNGKVLVIAVSSDVTIYTRA